MARTAGDGDGPGSGTGPSKRDGTYSSSKMAIIRLASGLLAIWGIWRNSSLSIEPEPSLSSLRKRFLRRWISAAETDPSAYALGYTRRRH